MLFGLHLLPVPLTFIRNSASVHHIVHQLREVPAKQHEGRIQPKHFPSPAADPCSDTSHNPNDFIPSIALVESAYGISESVELERALELVLNVVACHELQGRNAKSSREQNELDRVGYVDPGRFGAFNVTDCGVDGLVLDGDSWNEVIGRFDDAAPGMLWLVSEVLLRGKWISATHVEPVLCTESRAGDELLLARLDIICCLLAEFDGHFSVLGAREVPELGQHCVPQTDIQMDTYSVGPAYSADGSFEEDMTATDCWTMRRSWQQTEQRT
jgi:hypothetical protein